MLPMLYAKTILLISFSMRGYSIGFNSEVFYHNADSTHNGFAAAQNNARALILIKYHVPSLYPNPLAYAIARFYRDCCLDLTHFGEIIHEKFLLHDSFVYVILALNLLPKYPQVTPLNPPRALPSSRQKIYLPLLPV